MIALGQDVTDASSPPLFFQTATVHRRFLSGYGSWFGRVRHLNFLLYFIPKAMYSTATEEFIVRCEHTMQDVSVKVAWS